MSEETEVQQWLKTIIRGKNNENVLEAFVTMFDDQGISTMEDFEFYEQKYWSEDLQGLRDRKLFKPGFVRKVLNGINEKRKAINKPELVIGDGSSSSAEAKSEPKPASAKDEWATWSRQDVKKWIQTVLAEQINDLDGCLKYVDGNDLNGKQLITMANSGKNTLGCSSKQGKYIIFGKLQEYQVMYYCMRIIAISTHIRI